LPIPIGTAAAIGGGWRVKVLSENYLPQCGQRSRSLPLSK
jgi:hypothetical protein